MKNQITYNNIILGEWKYYGEGNYNLYRQAVNPPKPYESSFSAIGFCINNIDVFKYNPKRAIWFITFDGCFNHLTDYFNKTAIGQNIYNQTYACPVIYKYQELEQYKEIIDQFIIKMDKLGSLI